MIAIHKRIKSFSDRWIQYCQEHRLKYKIVDCYSSNIISQLVDCNVLMWHWSHNDYRDLLFARQLILSVEKMGIKVYPNSNTCWHFDDKVGQKYLLEAIDAPLVPSFVFYEKQKALDWIKMTSFPIIFKLRGGAGSSNVSLIKTPNDAKIIIKKSFRSGFHLVGRFSNFNEKIWQLKRDKNIKSFKNLFKGFIRIFLPSSKLNLFRKEKGYVYFQKFIPNNKYDTRVIVFNSDKCIAVRRYNRTNDFRASGSGKKGYSKELFDKKLLSEAFKLSEKLKTQTLAIDFVFDSKEPKILEISYGFVTGSFYEDCPGYWDKNLNWHKADIKPEYFIIENLMKE